MGDTGLLVLNPDASQTVLSGEANLFMGSVTENYVLRL
jgi:hypothetical protein